MRESREAADQAGRPFLLLDSGDSLYATNVLGHVGRADVRRARGIMRVMGSLGYAAMAVGPRDLAGGYDALLSASQDAGIRLLAANLRVSKGRRPFHPYEIMELDGLRVGVVGLATADHSVQVAEIFSAAGVTATDPVAAARAAVDAVSEEADLVLILGNLNRREIAAIGREVEGAHLMLTSGSGQVVLAEEHPLMLRYEPGGHGQILLRMDVSLTGEGRLVDRRMRSAQTDGSGGVVASRTHPLLDEVAEDPDVAAMIAEIEAGETLE